jgi:hypothetical protein
VDTTPDDLAEAKVPLDVVERACPTVYCTPDKDPPGRRHWNPTVSFYCPLCRRRHEHGNPGRRTEPGTVVGTRASHCDSDGPRLGTYELVIGEEQWRPARRRKQRENA